jgi:hypothetical protein
MNVRPWDIGDTFYTHDDDFTHLNILISDPVLDPEKLVVVNISSLRENNSLLDRTCVLNAGDHAAITHDSFIVFSESYETSVEMLQYKLEHKELQRAAALESSALQKILQKCSDARLFKRAFKSLLRDQNLI